LPAIAAISKWFASIDVPNCFLQKKINKYLRVKLKKKSETVTGKLEMMQVNQLAFLPREGCAYLMGQHQGYRCMSCTKEVG